VDDICPIANGRTVPTITVILHIGHVQWLEYSTTSNHTGSLHDERKIAVVRASPREI